MRIEVVVAVALLATPSAAMAQSTVPRIYAPAQIPADNRPEGNAARRLMDQYGQCVVMRSRRGAEAFARTAPGSREAALAARRLASGECLSGGEMRLREPLLRAAVFDSLYRVRFASTLPPDIASAPALDYAAGLDRADSNTETMIAIRQIVDCGFRRAPAEARAVVLAAVGSRQESEGMQRFAAALPSCIRQGQSVRLTATTLRGVMSEVGYRLAIGTVPVRENASQ